MTDANAIRREALDIALRDELVNQFKMLLLNVSDESRRSHVDKPDARTRCENGICLAFLLYQEQLAKITGP